MKTFFLDDSRQRQYKAHSEIAGHFVGAFDAETAIAHLSQSESVYDLISLDHDLIGVFCPSDNQSGFAVAQAVAAMPDERLPKKVIVHSWNYDKSKTPPYGGVGNMIEALRPLEQRGVIVIALPFDSAEYWKEIES